MKLILEGKRKTKENHIKKDKEYTKGENHINELEGFWGYLKRKLASKGGIRKKYFYLFLGEYVWRRVCLEESMFGDTNIESLKLNKKLTVY